MTTRAPRSSTNAKLSSRREMDLYFAELDDSLTKMTPHEVDAYKAWCKTLDEDGDVRVEHGIFPSTMEAHGVEHTEPTPICMIDELVPNPREHERHLAHLRVSESEMSDSTSCEV